MSGSSASSKLLVLDFDGTMTNAETEGLPYRKSYLDDMTTLCGKGFQELDELASTYEAKVRAHPNDCGWVVNGRIVAPASVDPYLRMNNIANRILDDLGLFQLAVERTRVLELLYKYSYLKTGTAFHDGAREALESLKGTPTWVVTNSFPTPVRRKLENLGANEDGSNSLDWMQERVNGLAKKYELDQDFDAVPESMHLPGLARPVFLRRKNYYRVLMSIMEQAGCDWKDLVVVGDIFELDLALPLAMGARVGLMANAYTPAYEKEFLDRSERGCVLQGVHQIPEFAFGLPCIKKPNSTDGAEDGERPAKAQKR